MRQVFIAVFFFFAFGSARAQTPAGSNTAGFRPEGRNVFFSTTKAAVSLACCTPKMSRVRTSRGGPFADNEPYLALPLTLNQQNDFFQMQPFSLLIGVKKAPLLPAYAPNRRFCGRGIPADSLQLDVT